MVRVGAGSRRMDVNAFPWTVVYALARSGHAAFGHVQKATNGFALMA
jgi:hypothetical protein